MVKIRLRRIGAKKQPSYRLVVADSRAPRDGRFIETIGHYDPRTDPPKVVVFEDRALYWLSVGAQPSDPVSGFFEKLGLPAKLAQVHAGAKIAEVAAPRAKAAVAEASAEAAPAKPGRARAAKKAAPEVGEAAEEVAVAAEAVAVAAEPVAEAATEVAAATAVALTAEEAAEGVEQAAEAGDAVAEASEAVAEAAKVAEKPAPVGAATLPALADLGLSARVLKALETEGIGETAQLLAKLSEGTDALLSISGIGAKAVDEVIEKLREHGLSVGA